jgi:hypothetical protein
MGLGKISRCDGREFETWKNFRISLIGGCFLTGRVVRFSGISDRRAL